MDVATLEVVPESVPKSWIEYIASPRAAVAASATQISAQETLKAR